MHLVGLFRISLTDDMSCNYGQASAPALWRESYRSRQTLARAGSRSIEKSSKRWYWVTEGLKAEVERGWLFGSLGESWPFVCSLLVSVTGLVICRGKGAHLLPCTDMLADHVALCMVCNT